MEKEDNHFLKKLLATFRIEAQEHIRVLCLGLIELEKASTSARQGELAETIFREAHSLKGAARAVNMTAIEALCGSLENVFSALKNQTVTVSPQLLDLLHQTVDIAQDLVAHLGPQPLNLEQYLPAGLIERLERAAKGSEVRDQRSGTTGQGSEFGGLVLPSSESLAASDRTPASAVTETIRVSAAKLTSILLQAEELLLAKLAVGQRAAELHDAGLDLATWGKEWAKVLPEVQKLRHVSEKEGTEIHNAAGRLPSANLPEFFDRHYRHLKSLGNRLSALGMSTEHDHHFLSRMIDTLLEDMRKVLMLPFSSVLEAFPKLVRDLSRDQGKEVELVIRGGEVEIDRRIFEEVKSPLIHLVRNCVDHGIEHPKERIKNKKPPKGQIIIAIEEKGNQAEILISDDGSGIDPNRIKAAALRLGVLSQEEVDTMPDSEALSCIFRSGLSTSPIITDVSGRGLGLAIVREKVENLGGAVFFESSPVSGTTFRIVLPLTLATFRGVIVRAADHLSALPTAAVERVVRINAGAVKTVENREAIELNGKVVSVVRLGEVLELSRQSRTNNFPETLLVVVVASGGQRIAFLVDEVINEQEVLQKNLGTQLARVRNIAGAAVLGTGRVVPILYVPDLIKSAVQLSMAGAGSPRVPPEAEKVRKKAVIVVEDSITARTLLKNILETAGYDVATATDGVDGFTQLKSEEFDLVVSDVDMPRMNGFDLTAKIRADKKLAELPVVLVTALESREDRERGIEVGANAYIVKSSFDQSNLLEVIERLI